MSYEIVKKIKIVGDKVYTTQDSNNVWPRYFDEREHPGLTRILQEEGLEKLNLTILELYEEGSFQPGIKNKWSNAIERLQATKEYEKYSWRHRDWGNDNCPIEASRRTDDFKKLLLDSLNLKPCNKFFILKVSSRNNYYLNKVLKRKIVFDFGIEKAKKLTEWEADNVILRFSYLEKIKI
jgi:hypothetical protein